MATTTRPSTLTEISSEESVSNTQLGGVSTQPAPGNDAPLAVVIKHPRADEIELPSGE